MSILEEIFNHKRREVAARMAARPQESVRLAALDTPRPPDFISALRDPSKRQPTLIAEVKHRSPSRGILSHNFRPLELAETYRKNGAAAISVLTDESYFGGSLEILAQVNRHLSQSGAGIPTLLKDFVFSEYQVLEAAEAGASAVLLIAAVLQPRELGFLIDIVRAAGLAPLVEVHDSHELERALASGADLIGINNRDLHTFQVDLQTSLRLRPLVPPEVCVVAESGIRSEEDIRQLAEAGVDAMLVGESLVTAEDTAEAVRRFAGGLQ